MADSMLCLREEVLNIRRGIIDKMDKIPEDGPLLQFITSSEKKIWLSITCSNTETMKWMLNMANNTKPWKVNTNGDRG